MMSCIDKISHSVFGGVFSTEVEKCARLKEHDQAHFQQTKCSLDSAGVYRQYHIVYKYLICNLDNPLKIVRNINQNVSVCVRVRMPNVDSSEIAYITLHEEYIRFHHLTTMKIIH